MRPRRRGGGSRAGSEAGEDPADPSDPPDGADAPAPPAPHDPAPEPKPRSRTTTRARARRRTRAFPLTPCLRNQGSGFGGQVQSWPLRRWAFDVRFSCSFKPGPEAPGGRLPPDTRPGRGREPTTQNPKPTTVPLPRPPGHCIPARGAVSLLRVAGATSSLRPKRLQATVLH